MSSTPSLTRDTLDALRGKVRGEVLTPDDPGFDAARAVWNGMIDKHPQVILRCRGAADVITGVSVAREHGLPLSVRSGGHSVAGKAICDDGVVIDLSLMNDVHVDPVARRARVGGGALWQDFDHEAQAFGLTSTGGVVSTT
ncbi:MAG: FAD-dependent oxidoreductase, partial [Pseudomonadales bacterium]